MVHRMFAALFIGFCVGLAFHQTWKYEREVARYGFALEKHRGRETVVWISPLYLPMFFIIVFVLLFVLRDNGVAVSFLKEYVLELIVTLLLYYSCLLLILPLLRRIFSARACAVLWLLPVFLYWMRQLWINNTIEPLLILRIPRSVLKPFAVIWAVGTAVTAIWMLASHLVFRRNILKSAKPVGINDISRLWEKRTGTH